MIVVMSLASSWQRVKIVGPGIQFLLARGEVYYNRLTYQRNQVVEDSPSGKLFKFRSQKVVFIGSESFENFFVST